MKIFNKLSNYFEQQLNSTRPTGYSMNTNQVDKFEKYAYIDSRFDMNSTYNIFGQKVNSFAATRPVVDQIKRDGFNGIVLNLNVPINVETGELALFDKNVPNGDQGTANKNIPKDTWAVVQYAKRMKLDVTLNFNFVNYKNDELVMADNVGANFSKEKFFTAIRDYETKIAATASKYKVDMIGIGNFQFGFDTEQYKSDWQNIVSGIKSKFKGKLTYTSNPEGDTSIFELVDTIGVGQGANNPDKNTVLSNISRLKNKYGKEVYWNPIAATATDNGIDPWALVSNSKDLGSVPIRSDLQADRIREILKASIIDQPTDLSGIAFYEYAPWKQADFMVNPKSDGDKQWQIFGKVHSEYYKNQTASDTFKNWFNYSTKDIVGNNRNNQLETFAGDKKIDGKGGIDTLVIHNSIKNCRITKDTVNGGFDVDNGINGIDGNYDMYGVEYVKFNDATVSLIGNYDLSKYGWF